MKDIVERWDLTPDLSISRVLTGLWQIADMEREGRELDPAATAIAMAPYVQAGFTTFDMADQYGSAEVIAGHFAREHGHEAVQLFTKWVPTPGSASRDDVRAAVQKALNRLRSDRLDLLQFHAWNYADPSYLDSLSYLHELKDEGLIRHLGMTNVDTAHLRMILNSGFKIVSNEDNLQLFRFSLTMADHADIDAAVSQLHAIQGDCGDEYRRPPYLTAAGDLSDHLESLPPPFEVRTGDDGRTRVLSGTIWEELAGFSRAVRRGDRILISGTTATHGDRVIGGNDPASQADCVIDKIEGALLSLAATLQDIVRTRIYLKTMVHWEAVAKVHGRRFRGILPANTLVSADIIGSEYLVEIEAEALIGNSEMWGKRRK